MYLKPMLLQKQKGIIHFLFIKNLSYNNILRAIDKFKNLDRLNTENATTTEQNSIHQNSIK